MSTTRSHTTPTLRRGRRLRVVAVAVALAATAVTLSSTADAAPAPPAPRPATPCVVEVKACARLSTNEAWLTDGRGTILLGPVRMNHGADGQETPTGQFAVRWKNKDHFSREAGGTPMPFSVFFDDHGRAFHGGDPARQSAGCVRMPVESAKVFFESLQPTDRVQILP